MPKIRRLLMALLAPCALALPQTVTAKQGGPSVSLEITSRGPAFGGQSFGEYGVYERIAGKAHMRIDPLAPANRGIADLTLAPRASDGMVDYDIDFVIERPKDPAKARRVLFYDVVNRGMRLLAMMTGGNMMKPDDPGDALLMRQGYTLVASGWQGDLGTSGAAMLGALPPGMALPKFIAARFPVATNKGKPITGQVFTETIFENSTSNVMTLPYAVGGDDPALTRLTVRALADSPPQTVKEWRFTDDRHIEIKRPAGFDAGAIYRFEYVAKDPWVMGLGFAATRDLIAFLRHAPAAMGNPLADIASAPCERDAANRCANPGGGAFSSAVAFGGSQSGRYLRDFLWQGFNRDPAGRRVFDGVIPFIPGARRTFTNFRFSEPGRFSRQHEDHGVPGFAFPFTYATLTDPATGKRDGILRACTATDTCPKLFHIDTSGEFWQAGSSLVGTGGTARDVPFPSEVRAYMIAGGAHAPGMVIPACRYPANALNYSPVVRALILSMVDWSLAKRNPPASRWPSLAKRELLPLEQLRGPQVPAAGLEWPKVMNRPLPPAGKREWPMHVPAIDADGNDAPGIRLPQLAAPQGTYLGWNLRKAGYGEGDLCLLSGTYLPFAKDAASRSGDSRLSLAERYPAAGEREAKFAAAAAELRREGFLLEEDAVRLKEPVGSN